MPSIVLTYQKVLLLCGRFFWFIFGLTLTTRLLESCSLVGGLRAHHDQLLLLIEIGVPIAGLIFGAATDAALLGILRQPDQTSWSLVCSSVRANTWVLFWLIFRIALIALGAMLPFLLVIRWLHWIPLSSFAVAFVYLILIKYALAYPIAVDQQLDGTQALKKSWEMTRGHFWHVLFCYLLMASAHTVVNQLFAAPWLDANTPFSVAFFIKHAADGFFNSLWIVLGWQMYLDIKEADEAPGLLRNEDFAAPTNS